jgi:uncharacterized membrane protein YciS (DUF1049 family)
VRLSDLVPICLWGAELWLIWVLCCRLRQVDVKAEHFERQLARAEQERDQWEKKAEVRARSLVVR